ncbi:hypothetical protein ACEPAI_6432 [Sanghuangporus weigelae]
MATQCRATYRSVLRELAKSSIVPRASRNHEIARTFRSIFDEQCSSSSSKDSEKLFRDMRNATTFLRAQRIHKELLDRYNPLHDMTQEERVKATANRVGLNTPIDVKKPDENDR